MKHDAEHQLRELIRQVIREELKSREVKKDPETGITTSDLQDKEGKRVGYMKHKELPTGGFVAGGRLGPKAAEKKVDETTATSSDDEEPKKDDEEKPKRPRRRKDKRSIEDISREMGQIEMFQEKYTVDEWVNLLSEYGVFPEAKLTPNVDELKKSTLASYIKKAVGDKGAYASAVRSATDASQRAKDAGDYNKSRELNRKAEKMFSKSWKREKGIRTAASKLAGETPENLPFPPYNKY